MANAAPSPLNVSRLRRAALPGLAFASLAAFYFRSLGHPSLWLDEAWEANYYLGIVPEPWYNRPVLYMAAERLMANLFGPGEFALRLLPCLAGLATIAATWRLVRRTIGGAADGNRRGAAHAWFAAGLLAIAPTFLYEAHQLKNYTFDALFTVLLLIAYLRYRESPTLRRLAVFALTGLVSFGFSFTSIFVLAAIGAVHVIGSVLAVWRGARRELVLFVGANVLLVAAFAVIYKIFHASAQGDTLLKDYFADAWPPLADPMALPGWLARQSRVLGEIAGASSFVAFALILAAGAWHDLAGRSRQDAPDEGVPPRPGTAGLLTAVMAACMLILLATSALHLYPYGSARLTLFLAPLIAALAAAGMLEALGGGWLRWVAVTGLLYVLMYPAVAGAVPYVSRGWGTDELRRNIGALAREHAPGEGIFVPERASASFTYYWWRAGKGTGDADILWGERHRLHPKDHAAQIAHIAQAHPSLWVIFDDQSREERETLRGFLLERYESVRRVGDRDAESLELFRRRAVSADTR